MGFEFGSVFLGVDFKVKYLTIGEKKLKLAIWDTGKKTSQSSCVLRKKIHAIYENVNDNVEYDTFNLLPCIV